MKKSILFILFLVRLVQLLTCTIGISSAEINADSKPLLWKSRDVLSFANNSILYSETTLYKFIGITNPNQHQVWMGVNNQGLAIANSLSQDLAEPTSRFNNGDLMRNGLSLCANLDELEEYFTYVTTSTTDRELKANIVAFDAEGNSKLYEISNTSYTIFDTETNDDQFYVRTNFSVTGGGTTGLERYNRSFDIISDLANEQDLSVNNLLSNHIRDVADFNGIPLQLPWQYGDSSPLVDTSYSICRNSTISAVVIEGVEAGEDPKFTTMWLVMGNPFTTYAVPLLPFVEPPLQTLNLLSQRSADAVELLWRGENNYLLDSSLFINPEQFSFLESIEDNEQLLFDEREELIEQWQENMPSNSVIANYQEEIAQNALFYTTNFVEQSTSNSDNCEVIKESLTNYPNPFNPETTVKFSLRKRSNISLKIYNIKGQLIEHIERNNMHVGENSIVWNGQNSANKPVTSGVYMYVLKTDNAEYRNKMVLLK